MCSCLVLYLVKCEWDRRRFMVFEGVWVEVDEICSGPIGSQPIVAIGLDVRRIEVDELLGAARSCILSIVIYKMVLVVAVRTFCNWLYSIV